MRKQSLKKLFLNYTMRHVQEHATRLNLFLGQNGNSEVSDWAKRVKTD
jgi:hypothetical protein